MEDEPEMVKVALRYARLGWSVIPLKRDKTPYLESWKEFQIRRATEQEIMAWWQRWPDANVGIVTGPISGIVVLDVDKPEGRRFLEEKGIRPTVQSNTAKGSHVYLKHPGWAVPNKVNPELGVDVRGDGGYVVAPPSIHPTGVVYQWEAGLNPWDAQMEPMPHEMLLYARGKENGNGSGENQASWAPEALVGVHQGNRNDTCARLAGLLISMGASNTEALNFLLTWNEKNQPPLPELEVVRTFKSVKSADERNHPERMARQQPEDIHILTLGELHRMAVEFPPPVIDGLLDSCDSLLLTGQAGVGKSLMALAVALAVASGRKLFRKFEICQPGPVLIVQSENSLKATKARLEAILKSSSNDEERSTYEQAMERIAMPMVGQDVRLSGDILSDGFMRKLREAIQRTEARLLVLDPLISFHRKDENDNVGMRKVLDRLTELSVGTGVSLLVVHHHGKGQYEGMNQSRGATAIVDWARGVLTLNPEQHPERLLVKCEHSKHGNFPKAPVLLLEVTGPHICAVDPDLACTPSRVVEVLLEIGGEAKSQNVLVKALEEICGISRRTAQDGIKRARDYGLIRFKKCGKSFSVYVVK